MKVKVFHKIKVPFNMVMVGDTFAFGSPSKDGVVYVYMKLASRTEGVVLYPSEYQGHVVPFDPKTQVVEVKSVMRVDGMPNIMDFEEKE